MASCYRNIGKGNIIINNINEKTQQLKQKKL